MKEIIFSSSIQKILWKSEEKDKFLMLSTENNQIIWVIKVQGKEKEFWDLIQLTIPFGVTIKGIAINNEKDLLINGLYLVNKRNEMERKELIDKCFLIISYRNDENIRKVVINENSVEIDLNNFINQRTQISLKDSILLFNDEPAKTLNEKYSKVFSNVYRNIERNIQDSNKVNDKDENSGNEEEEENREIYEEDFNEMSIMIQQLGFTIKKNEWTLNWNQMQKKFSTYLNENNNSLELQLLFPSSSNSSFQSTSTIITNRSVNKENLFNISINALVSKSSNLKAFIEKYKSYSKWLIYKVSNMNHIQPTIISLYSIQIIDISLPISLVYSIPQEMKCYKTSLSQQSHYYRNIFSLGEQQTIAFSFLHNHLEYSSMKNFNSNTSFNDTIQTLHQYLNRNEKENIINGDYLTYICHFEDKSYGCGYRALQTSMSWFYFNNKDDYPNYTIPTLQDIKQALVLLDELSCNDIDKPYDISINQLGQVFGFLIDSKCESTSLYNYQQSLFKEELSKAFCNMSNDGHECIFIVSLGKNNIFTVIGFNTETDNILLITHNYIGKISLISMLKMNTIQWIDISSFLKDIKKFNYLKIYLK